MPALVTVALQEFVKLRRWVFMTQAPEKTQSHTFVLQLSAPPASNSWAEFPGFFLLTSSASPTSRGLWFHNNWHWINLPRKTMLQRVQCALTKKIIEQMQIWVASQFLDCPGRLQWKEACIILYRCFLSEFNTWIYKFYSQILERQFPLERKKDTYTYTQRNKNKVFQEPFSRDYYCFQNLLPPLYTTECAVKLFPLLIQATHWTYS